MDLLDLVAKVKLDSTEYEKGLSDLAEQYGYDDVDEFEDEAGADAAKKMILQNKVGEFLKEHCKFVKAKETKEDK